jgi:hypothetical protein
MGIAFSHCHVSIPHRWFGTLQERLAEEAGIRHYANWWRRTVSEEELKPFERVAWHEYKDPLEPFLKAGSVEGSLSPEECLALKRRFRELAARWTRREDQGLRELALALAEGMALAAFNGERFTWHG